MANDVLTTKQIEEREKQAFAEAMANVKTNALTEPLPPFELQDDAKIQGEVVISTSGELKSTEDVIVPAEEVAVVEEEAAPVEEVPERQSFKFQKK